MWPGSVIVMDEPRSASCRYLPLAYRVAALNAALLLTAVVVTLLVLAPRRFSTVAVDEAIVLFLALLLAASINMVVLRRVIGPVTTLTELTRRVDLSRPGTRMPVDHPASEAGELSLSFNQMLQRLETERREATGRALAGQEAERLRIAQELHDQIGQELTAVLLGLSRLHALSGPAGQLLVEEVRDAVRASLQDVRSIALELRPEALDELGLVTAISVLCERLHERTGIEISQMVDPALPDLEPDVELVIYRVAQEALTNVIRHSGVKEAWLTLRHDRARVVLEVVDHGQGLPQIARPGTGIRGMLERATLVGGRLEISAGEGGRGCELRLFVDDSASFLSSARTVAARDGTAGHPYPARR